MAVTHIFQPPRRHPLAPPYTFFVAACARRAPLRLIASTVLTETTAEGATLTREARQVDLADTAERERVVALYMQRYGLDPESLDSTLKAAYSDVEAELRRAPAMPPRQADGTLETAHGDLFNAEWMMRRHGATLRYCPPWKKWLYWTGTHWHRDHGNEVMECARETIRYLGHQALDAQDAVLLKHVAKSLNHQPLQRMIAQASTLPGVSIEPEAFDQQPYLLNCPNGTIDLTKGTLMEHDPAHLLSKCLDVEYQPEAPCPTWLSFLWRVMGGKAPIDPDTDNGASFEMTAEADALADARATRLIAFLQRALGYACTGDTGEECLFLLHGSGRNGKSKFLSTIKTLLGPYAKTADMHSFLHKDRETVRNDLADLVGTRFVCASEVNEHTRLAEGLIKQLTGNDNIKARFLFEEYFEFPPTFKLFLAFNHRPRTGYTDDEAFWSRIKEIPFTVFIPEEERDHELGKKLCAELPGILAWMVQGCLAWQAQQLATPEEVRAATNEYREENDRVGRFLQECCFCDSGNDSIRELPGPLFAAFSRWCEMSGEGNPGTQNLFGRALTARGYPVKTGTNNKAYRVGVGLQAHEDDEQEGQKKDKKYYKERVR